MTITTRLYLQNATAPYSPTTLRGAWDATASAVTKYLGAYAAGTATTVAIAEVSTTNNWDVLLARFVSDGFANAVTLSASDTVQWIAGLKESSTSANAFVHVHIYVTQGDSDTPRGTLLSDFIGATEFTTTAGGRGEGAKSLAGTVACSVGDRIVVEIGYQDQNTVSTSFTSTLNYGAAGPDLTNGSTSVTTQAGWVEFVTASNPFAASTLDANNKNSNITLSGGNLIATAGATSTNNYNVRGTVPRGAVKFVFGGTIKGDANAGMVNAAFAMSSDATIDQTSNGFDFWSDGTDMHFETNNAGVVCGSGQGWATPLSTALPFWIAVDGAGLLTWCKVGTGFWNGVATANPDTGVGGKTFAVAGSLFPFLATFLSGDVATYDGTAAGHGLTSFTPIDPATGISGVLNATLDALTVAATGTLAIQGSAAITLAPMTVAATGKLVIQGALNATLDSIGLVATGTGQTTINGALNATLADMTVVATGVLPINGALSATLDNLTVAATGVLPIKGALAVTLDAMTVAASGVLPIQAQVNATLAPLTLVATGKLPIQSVGNITLADLSVAATGKLVIQAAANITLGALTVSATGVLPIKGALNVTLDSIQLNATGLLGFTGIAGQLSATLQDMSVVATGKLVIAGAANITLDNLTSVASGKLVIAGALNGVLGDLVSASAGKVIIGGRVAATLGDLTLLATGALKISAVANLTFDDMTGSGTGLHIGAGVFGSTPRYVFKALARNRTFKALARDRTFTADERPRDFRGEQRNRTYEAPARPRSNED